MYLDLQRSGRGHNRSRAGRRRKYPRKQQSLTCSHAASLAERNVTNSLRCFVTTHAQHSLGGEERREWERRSENRITQRKRACINMMRGWGREGNERGRK